MRAQSAAPGLASGNGRIIEGGDASDRNTVCPKCGGPTVNQLDVDGTDYCGKCIVRLIEELKVLGLNDLADSFTNNNDIDPPNRTDAELYAACRTKGNRATKKEMAIRHEALVRLVTEIKPCSVRGAYYQATVRGIVDKTDAGYDKVQRALVDLRRAKRLPYRYITDNTRWQMKSTSYDSIQDALQQTAKLYRRALWTDADAYVEVWLEKDALAGIVFPITDKYDVPIQVARGFSSLSFLYSAAEYIADVGKPTYIYHLGDHDPSGVCAGQKIEQTLREFAPDAEIHFQRLAVLPWQIKAWNLPTRPTKKTDSRAKNFSGDSVELDAIHPHTLRQIVEEAITQHLPAGQLNVLKIAEESEREMLQMFAHEAAL